jgi:hypothetical protein
VRRLVPADADWVGLLPGGLSREAWADPAAAGLWSPSAIHLAEQPVGALALAAVDRIHRTAHLVIAGPQDLAPLIPVVFHQYAIVAAAALELRKIYLVWDWPWPPPPTLGRIAPREGHQPDSKVTDGVRHDTYVHAYWHRSGRRVAADVDRVRP